MRRREPPTTERMEDFPTKRRDGIGDARGAGHIADGGKSRSGDGGTGNAGDKERDARDKADDGKSRNGTGDASDKEEDDEDGSNNSKQEDDICAVPAL